MRTKEEILLWKLKVSLQGGCEGVSLYEEGMTEEEKKPYKDLLLKEARTLLEEDRRFRNLYVEGPIRELCRFATACAGIKELLEKQEASNRLLDKLSYVEQC